MRKWKRGVAALGVFTLGIAALTGCGSSAADAQNGGGNAQAKGRETVTFWQGKLTDKEDAWFKEQAKAFNDSQDKVYVNYQLIPSDAWDQKMKAAQAAKTAPDVYTRAYNQIATGAKQGAIKPLTDLLPQSAWDDLEPSVKNMVTVDGKQYAYPLLVEPSMVLWYRADLFKKAGLDPNKPPTTWDELMADAKKLSNGKTVFGMSLAQDSNEVGWTTWGLQYAAAGHLPMSADWSKGLANDPKYQKLLELYRTMYKDGSMPKQALASYNDISPYGQGKLAMTACGSWAAADLVSDYPKVAAETRVAKFPTPTGDAKTPSSTLGGWTLVVDGNSKHAKAAADFINYAVANSNTTALENYFKSVTNYSKYSARKSVTAKLNADTGAAKANPWRSYISEKVVPYSIPEATYDWTISLAMSDAILKGMQGKATPEQALATAQSTITSQIKKLGIAGTGPGAK